MKYKYFTNAKIHTLYRDCLRSLNQEKEQLLELRRREGEFQNHSLYCTECRAICYLIYYKIYLFEQVTTLESEGNKWKQRTCDREQEVFSVQQDLTLLQDKVSQYINSYHLVFFF